MEVPKCRTFPLESRLQIDEMTKLTSNFFINTKEYIRSLEGYSREDFAISHFGARTGSRLNYLLYQDQYVVAGVVKTFSSSDEPHYAFFRDLSCLEKS